MSASLPAALSTAGLLGAVALSTLSTVAVPMAAAHTHPAASIQTIAQTPARATIVAVATPRRATRAAVRKPVTRTVTRTVPIGPVESGIASWYGPGFAGRRTSSGEIFRPSEMTAAHKFLPFGTLAKVCASSGRCVIVRITDRGPFVAGRIVDLSDGAHNALGMGGLASVTLTPLGTHTVTETITEKVAPVRASRSQARTRILAGELHPERSTGARGAAPVLVATRSVVGPRSDASMPYESPAAALAPLATLAGFGAFRGKFRLAPLEALALPEDH